MPIITPPDSLHLPLPRLAGQTWSWVDLQDGQWQTQSGRATVTLTDLRKARPGSIQITRDGHKERVVAADLLWTELLTHKWISEIASGRAYLVGRPKANSPPLGYEFGTSETESLLSKIAIGIQKTDHTARFATRPVAREGWLKLIPSSEDQT